jgi:hypothetical protein
MFFFSNEIRDALAASITDLINSPCNLLRWVALNAGKWTANRLFTVNVAPASLEFACSFKRNAFSLSNTSSLR